MQSIKRINIIGLGYQAGVGKDTVADYLVQAHGFVKASFAAPIKEICGIAFGWPREILEDREKKERIDPFWNMSPRQAMQRLGTECFRGHFDNEFWIKALQKRVLEQESPPERLVITDVRFPNEAEAIKRWGGQLWLVERPEFVVLSSETSDHSSENAMSFYTDWNAKLVNSGTIHNLYLQIESALLKK